MLLGKDGEDDLLGPGKVRCSPQGPTTAFSRPSWSGSATGAAATPWSSSGVTRVLMARSPRT